MPERLHVVLARTLATDAVASDEVVNGLREELARSGALEPGDGWPRAEVEVLRAEEESEGIAASSSGPRARATDLALVARAWITDDPRSGSRRDTGDVRASEVAAVDVTSGGLDARANGFHRRDALRAAARRLGQKLALKLMGKTAASDEMVDR